MASPPPIDPIVRELRSLASTPRRRAVRMNDAAPLLARLVAACRTLAMEPRPNGITFRLEGGDPDAVRLTCFLHHDDAARLTPTEAEVAGLLCDGRTLAQIARLRGVSVNTIKSQVRQIFRKLNVESRVALVRRLGP